MMIPKKFSLTFRNYKVKTVDKDLDGDRVLYGHVIPACNEIVIADNIETGKVSDLEKLATFNHELVHGILHAMGEMELFENERFVEGFAQLLTQYELTRKY